MAANGPELGAISDAVVGLIGLAKAAASIPGAESAPTLLRLSKDLMESFVEVSKKFQGKSSPVQVRTAVARVDRRLRLMDQGLQGVFPTGQAQHSERAALVVKGLSAVAAISEIYKEDSSMATESEVDLSSSFDAMIEKTKQASQSDLLASSTAGNNTSSASSSESDMLNPGRSKTRARSRSPRRHRTRGAKAARSPSPNKTGPEADSRTIEQSAVAEPHTPGTPERLNPRSLPSKQSSHFGTLSRSQKLAQYASQCSVASCVCTSFGSNLWQENRCVNCMHMQDRHHIRSQTPADLERRDAISRGRSWIESRATPIAVRPTPDEGTSVVRSTTRTQVATAPSMNNESASTVESVPQTDNELSVESGSAPARPLPKKGSAGSHGRNALRFGATMFLTDLDTRVLKSGPAHYFAQEGNLLELMRVISEAKPSPEVLWANANTNLQTPLHLALQNHHDEAAGVLTDVYIAAETTPSPLNIGDKVDRTALHYAARYGVESVLRRMVGLQLSLKEWLCGDMFGDTALHLAAANCHTSCVRLILDAHDDAGKENLVESTNNFGETPLHKAARSGDSSTVELLLQCGANVEAMSAQGTPFDVLPVSLEGSVGVHLRKLLAVSQSNPSLNIGRLPADQKLANGLKDIADDNSIEEHIGQALGEVYGEFTEPSLEKVDAADRGLVIARPNVSDIYVYRSARAPPALNISLGNSATVPIDSGSVSIDVISDLTNFVEGVFEPFRNNYFNKRYWTFCVADLFALRDGETAPDPDRPTEPALFLVKRSAEGGVFEALFINKWGFNPYFLPETAVAKRLSSEIGADRKELLAQLKSASPPEIVEAIRAHVERLSRDPSALDFSPDFDRETRKQAQKFMETMSPIKTAFSADAKGTSTPKLRTKRQTLGLFAVTPFSRQKKQGKRAQKRMTKDLSKVSSKAWYVVNDTSAGGAMLGLEAKLGRGTVNSFGLVNCLSEQSGEAEFFKNPSTPAFDNFCAILGDHVDVRGWSGFNGGFDTMTDDITSVYTSWRGFEVMWHPAPAMSADLQRRLLGNDKVVVYYQDHPRRPFIPRFRGNVNSVGVVVAEQDDGFHVEVFARSRVQGFNPELPSVPFKKTEHKELRNWVITTALNATTAVYQSPPYVYMLASAWNQALQGFVQSFPPPH